MIDTPEPVAVSRKLAVSFAEYIQGQSSTPRCEPPSEGAIKIAETLLARVTGFFKAVGTPLYTAPISLYESQVRWREAFDAMHQRAMNAEATVERQAADIAELRSFTKDVAAAMLVYGRAFGAAMLPLYEKDADEVYDKARGLSKPRKALEDTNG